MENRSIKDVALGQQDKYHCLLNSQLSSWNQSTRNYRSKARHSLRNLLPPTVNLLMWIFTGSWGQAHLLSWGVKPEWSKRETLWPSHSGLQDDMLIHVPPTRHASSCLFCPCGWGHKQSLWGGSCPDGKTSLTSSRFSSLSVPQPGEEIQSVLKLGFQPEGTRAVLGECQSKCTQPCPALPQMTKGVPLIYLGIRGVERTPDMI